MRILELPDRLRARGLDVVEVAGWQTRGREFPSRPDICIRHWTAGARNGSTPSLAVVTHGRTDLRGPLCHVLQSREAGGRDRVFVVASGIANHAGRGEWAGVSGNSRSLGLEIEWSGPDEPFSAERKLVSELAMRALMDCALGTNTDDACEHREYARPAGRKIDTNLDGDELRRRMRELAGDTPAPDPGTTVIVEAGDTLAAIAQRHATTPLALIERNPFLLDRTVIRPGDRLTVR